MSPKNAQFFFLNALLSILSSCLAAYEDPIRAAKILDYQLEHSGPGHYFFRFESSDGIVREEEGNVLDENSPESPIVVKGSYSYTDETGKAYTVRYIADEHGFHPEGDHIKVPSFVVNPNPVFVTSTVRPAVPVQFVQTTTQRPILPSTPTRLTVNSYSTTPRPTPGRIHIPTTPAPGRAASFNELDSKLQNSIVSLLSNGDARGFSVGSINSL